MIRESIGEGPSQFDREERVGRLADELAERLVSGETVDLEEFRQRYPDLAMELPEVYDSVRAFRDLCDDLRHSRQPSADTSGLASDSLSPRQLGDFEIVREVGRGGMGVVYEAHQISLDRRVALKVLPLAAMLDERMLLRFKTEAQAAASLHHDHIVPVYGVGCERGIHYYVMQFIDGHTLAEIVQADDRSAREPSPGMTSAATLPEVVAELSTQRSKSRHGSYRHVARVAMEAAEAVHYAHTQGILHRDVKPGNLMLDPHGKVWITDFGLAQVKSRDGVTLSGDLVGTLRYMSPEQISPGKRLVDERSDVYGLGATLYELVTGKPLFDQTDCGALVRQITAGQPANLRRNLSGTPADLATIITKAVEQNPVDRYPTALELAADLRRYVEHRPIAATPPGINVKIRKWILRNPHLATTLAAAAICVAVLATVAGAVSTTAYRQERHQRQLAERAITTANTESAIARKALAAETVARLQAQSNLYQAHIREAHEALTRGRVSRAESLLYQYLPVEGAADHRGWEWYYLVGKLNGGSTIVGAHPDTVGGVCWSADGRRFASVSQDRVKLWDSVAGRILRELHIPYAQMVGAAFSPDGTVLAITADNGILRLWQTSESQELRTLNPTHLEPWPSYGRLDWSPDGKTVATAANDGVVIWDVVRGVEQMRISTPPASKAISWRPDGQELAISSPLGDEFLYLVDAVSGKVRLRIDPHDEDINSVVWQSDGKRLATASNDQHTKILDAETGNVLLDLVHPSSVHNVQFSPDEQYLACATSGGQIFLWNASTGQLRARLFGNRGCVRSIDWSLDGKQLISGGDDGTVRLWNMRDGQGRLPQRVSIYSIDQDQERAERFIYRKDNDAIGIHDPLRDEVLYFTQNGERLYWNPSGGQLGVLDGQTVRVFDGTSGAVANTFSIPEGHRLTAGWSPDGTMLITCNDRELLVWDVENGSTLARFDVPGFQVAVWAPHEQHLAVWADQRVEILEVRRAVSLVRFDIGPMLPESLCWSPDGNRVAAGEWNGIVRVWEAQSGRLLHELIGHRNFVHWLAWSPDASLLASCGWDHTIKLWDATRGQEIRSLDGHNESVRSVAFHPTAARLASSDDNGTIKLWDVSTGEELVTLEDMDGGLGRFLAWSRDGNTLWSCAYGVRGPKGITIFDARRGYGMAADGELEANIASWSLSAGINLAHSGRIAASKQAFAVADRLVGPQAWAHRERAMRFLRRQMEEDAVADFEVATRVAPEEPTSRNQLAWLLANRHDQHAREPQRAEAIARDLLAQWPDQGEFWTTLGLAQYRQAKWREAVESLQTALQQGLNRSSRAHSILAMAQARLGNREQAKQSLKKADGYRFEWNDRRLRDEADRVLAETAPELPAS